MGYGEGRFAGKRDPSRNTNSGSPRQGDVTFASAAAVHGKIDRVSVPVRNIRAPRTNSFAPGGVIKVVDGPEADVAPTLTHIAAAHAGEIGFAARLERKAAVQDV